MISSPDFSQGSNVRPQGAGSGRRELNPAAADPGTKSSSKHSAARLQVLRYMCTVEKGLACLGFGPPLDSPF